MTHSATTSDSTIDTSSNQVITLKLSESVAYLSLNAPPLNILTTVMMRQMESALDSLEQNSETTVLVISGAGEKAFSAGASIEEHAPNKVVEMLSAFHEVCRQLALSEMTIIAEVHGHCLGGGAELALLCDFVVASDEAKFGFPEIKLGCFPPVAAALLPGLIGRKRADWLMVSGETISASNARDLGLVTHLSPANSLKQESAKLVKTVTSRSAAVVKLLRRSQPDWRSEFLSNLKNSESVFLEKLLVLEDMREGLTAYSKKRPPSWRNR